MKTSPYIQLKETALTTEQAVKEKKRDFPYEWILNCIVLISSFLLLYLNVGQGLQEFFKVIIFISGVNLARLWATYTLFKN